MDVLLVNGPYFIRSVLTTPHIGQAILQNILAPHYETETLSLDSLIFADGEASEADTPEILDGLARRIAEKRPKVVGFYTICNTFPAVLEICERLHAAAPEIQLIFGGPHATLTAEACLRSFDFLRAVCMGESEYSILPLVRALIGGESLEEAPGIAWKKDGQVRFNPHPPLVPAEKLTDYTVYDFGPEYDMSATRVDLEGGRGCPWGCSFCSTSRFWERCFRIKPVETLLAEMDRFYERTGNGEFAIQHDSFTANRKHLRAFCDALIARGSPYVWHCSSRVDVLDEEIIRRMAQSGCRSVYLGLETGSPRMQKKLHKNLNLDRAVWTAGFLNSQGIQVTVSFIYGLPEETEEDFLQTAGLIETLFLTGIGDLQLHRFFPLPATEAADQIREQAYFDPGDVDLSIYNRRMITPRGEELIRTYPELFIQYYTFDSPVRRNYSGVEAVVLMLSTNAFLFGGTVRNLLRKHGLIGLFRKYEPLFRELYLRYSDLEYGKHVQTFAVDALRRITEEENRPELRELFRFEEDCARYRTERRTETEIRTYGMDIPALLKDGTVRPGPCRMMLQRQGSVFRTNRVPDWLRFSEESEDGKGE